MTGGGFDATQYTGLADNLLRYGTFSMATGTDASPETFRTPGYPLLIALAKYITGTLYSISLFQIIILIASAFLAYLIALTVSPEHKNIALIVVALFVFDPMIFFSTQFVASECLYMFFLLLTLYLLIQRSHPRNWSYALAGLAYGLSAYVRPSGLYMIIPVGVWIVWKLIAGEDRRAMMKLVSIFLLVGFVTVAPWFIRNGTRTGVYAFSSLDAYNSINFNVPVYLSYRDDYKVSIEDIRADLHEKIGGLTDDEQMLLVNSPMIKRVVWQEIRPDLFGYVVFHISKTTNFFLSPGFKFEAEFLRGFWEGQPNESWHPETSLVNSLLDRNWKNILAWAYQNAVYIPESLLLLVMFVFGLYWYWRRIWRSEGVLLIFLVIFFLALLTSPISNPRYRVPVAPLIYLAGLSGLVLASRRLKGNDEV